MTLLWSMANWLHRSYFVSFIIYFVSKNSLSQIISLPDIIKSNTCKNQKPGISYLKTKGKKLKKNSWRSPKKLVCQHLPLNFSWFCQNRSLLIISKMTYRRKLWLNYWPKRIGMLCLRFLGKLAKLWLISFTDHWINIRS